MIRPRPVVSGLWFLAFCIPPAAWAVSDCKSKDFPTLLAMPFRGGQLIRLIAFPQNPPKPKNRFSTVIKPAVRTPIAPTNDKENCGFCPENCLIFVIAFWN